jgi:hypothetical protein
MNNGKRLECGNSLDQPQVEATNFITNISAKGLYSKDQKSQIKKSMRLSKRAAEIVDTLQPIE